MPLPTPSVILIKYADKASNAYWHRQFEISMDVKTWDNIVEMLEKLNRCGLAMTTIPNAEREISALFTEALNRYHEQIIAYTKTFDGTQEFGKRIDDVPLVSPLPIVNP